MKLTILVDNNTYIDQYYLGEPGVSYFIEDCGIRILFDTGYSDVYVRNAKKWVLIFPNWMQWFFLMVITIIPVD